LHNISRHANDAEIQEEISVKGEIANHKNVEEEWKSIKRTFTSYGYDSCERKEEIHAEGKYRRTKNIYSNRRNTSHRRTGTIAISLTG